MISRADAVNKNRMESLGVSARGWTEGDIRQYIHKGACNLHGFKGEAMPV